MNAEIKLLYDQIGGLKKKLREAIAAAEPEPVDDWELRDTDGAPVMLSELFDGCDDLLIVHNMGRSCRYCTLWADGFRGYVEQIRRRCAFALCSADEPHVLAEHAAERDWNFRCVSGAGSGFAGAMGMEGEDGSPWPGISAFHRSEDGQIVRTGNAFFGPGDDFCAVWPMFDLLRDGARGFEPE